MLNVSAFDRNPLVAGGDTVSMFYDNPSDRLRVIIRRDTMFFDLRKLAASHPGDPRDGNVPPERMRLDAIAGGRRATLAVSYLNGKRTGASVDVEGWQGILFLGKNP
jgi:hypothetical protein